MLKIRNTEDYKMQVEQLRKAHSDTWSARKLMEECGELIQAVNKLIDAKDAQDADIAQKNVSEEMADVSICIDIFRKEARIEDRELDEMIKSKMKRNMARIQMNNEQVRKAFAAAHECCGACS